jgi:ribosomal protein L14E/L6E/L27E
MKKLTLILLAAITICASIVYFNISSKEPLEILSTSATVKDLLSHNMSSISNTSLSFSPKPTVHLQFVTDKIKAENIKINLNLFNLIVGGNIVDTISIPELQVSNSFIDSNDHLYINSITSLLNIPDVDVNVTKLNITDNKAISTRFTNVHVVKSDNKATISFSTSDEAKVQSEITNDSSGINIQMDVKHKSVDANINYLLSENSIKSGNFVVNINNMKDCTELLTKYYDFVVARYIISPEKGVLSGRFALENGRSVINDIVFKSDSVDASAKYWFATDNKDVKEDHRNILSLKILSLNASQLFGRSQQNAFYSQPISDSNIHIVAEIDKILTSADDMIINTKIDMLGKGSRLDVLSCGGDIISSGSAGSFSLAGVLSSNEYRPAFDGQIVLKQFDIDQKNDNIIPLYIESNISLTPIASYMDEMKIQLGEINVFGKLGVKMIGSIPRIDGSLKISNFNFASQSAFLLKPVHEYFVNLSKNMTDNDYTSKYIPVRTLNAQLDCDITASNIDIAGTIVNKVNAIISFSPGVLSLESFYINILQNSIGGSMRLNANSIKPEYSFNITNGSLHFPSFTLDQIFQMQSKLNNTMDAEKIAISSQGAIDNVSFGDFTIKDLGWKASMQDQVLNISHGSYSIYDGTGEFSGSLIPSSPIKLNVTYGMHGIDIAKLKNSNKNSNLWQGLPYKSGWLSLNGQIFSTASSTNEFLYNLNATGEFLGKDIVVENFSIDDFIAKVLEPKYNFDNLPKSLNDVVSTGSTTIASTTGKYKINSGIANITDVSYTTQRTSAALSAAINIFNGETAAKSIISFMTLEDEKKKSKSEMIKMDFILSGSLQNPKKSVQFSTADELRKVKNGR